MNTKHTPGPWTVKGRKMEARIHGNVEGGPVAIVPYVTEWASNVYDEANARLIAAAPDLLAALVKLEDFMRWAQDNADTRGFLDAVDHANVTQAQQAIAKATNTL